MFTTGWRALGTSVVVAVADATALDSVREVVAAEIAALDLACSRFRPDSDLSRLNGAAGVPVVVSPLLGAAIRTALRAARLTDGAVDPTVGGAMASIGYDRDFAEVAADGPALPRSAPAAGAWSRVSIDATGLVRLPAGVSLDLGATAKALGADRAATAAHRAAACGVLVALGGDIATAGEPPAEGWAVRVTDTHDAPDDAPGQLITLVSGGLATSSTALRHWRRGGVEMHHIVDPHTGLPAITPYRTVSVAAASCVDANTASTAAIVRGRDAVTWLEATGLPARLVTAEGTVIRINRWPAGAEIAA